MKSKCRDELIQRFFKDDMLLLQSKGHDYAGEEDSLANLREFGLLGIVVRLGDKYCRLKQFVKSGGELLVQDEVIVDTLRDMSNYCYLARVLLEEKSKG